MDRREALRHFGFGGMGAGLLAHRAVARGVRARRVRTGLDDRIVDVVLDNASVFRSGPEGGRVEHDVSVRIEGNRIAEVGSGLSGGDRIDLTGHLLLPGLISGHTHVAAGSPTRGIIEGGRSYARPLTLVEDEARSAVPVNALCDRVMALGESDQRGTWHIAATRCVDRPALARRLLNSLGIDAELRTMRRSER